MDTNWYNTNENRAYPFRDDSTMQPPTITGGPVLANQLFMDAGIVTGPDTQFDPGADSIVLAQIQIDPGTQIFRVAFQVVYANASLGPVIWGQATGTWSRGTIVDLVAVDGSTDAPDMAIGFLVVNSSDTLYAWATAEALGTGLLDVDPTNQLEPALIQSLSPASSTGVASYVTGIDLYSDHGLDLTADPYVVTSIALGITGGLVFADGYNSRIAIDPISNVMTCATALGAGEGPPTDWVFPDTLQMASDLIYSINSLEPGTDRHFMITGNNGIVITPGAGSELAVAQNNDLSECGGT